jgi:ribonuclease P protein component
MGGPSRAGRLLSRRDFVRVQKAGVRAATKCFLVLATVAEGDATRLGVVASKKIGNAVVRNRAKRLVREVYRKHRALLAPPVDVVVIARAAAALLTAAQAEAELAGAFGRAARLAHTARPTQSESTTEGSRASRPR